MIIHNMKTLPEWAEIIEDPSEYIGKKVHVEGWSRGSVFVLVGYKPGRAQLVAHVRKHKEYVTGNRLYKKRDYSYV